MSVLILLQQCIATQALYHNDRFLTHETYE